MTGDEAAYFYAVEILPVEAKLGNHCLIAIVFSALAVEGYIYDYATRNLSDKFVDSHLDKLDVLSKWMVIPKLITGRDFPKNGHAYQLLKQLIQNRNFIVHSKSADAFITETGEFTGNAKRIMEFGSALLEKAENAIAALDELAVILENLDPNEYLSVRFRSPVGRAKEQFERTGVWPWG